MKVGDVKKVNGGGLTQATAGVDWKEKIKSDLKASPNVSSVEGKHFWHGKEDEESDRSSFRCRSRRQQH